MWGYSAMLWVGLALTSLLKQKKEDKSNQFLVLLVMTLCWQHWWDGTLSEAQMLCRRWKNTSMYLRHIHRITEWFGLEGIFKNHLVQLLTCPKGISKRGITKNCYSMDTRRMINCLQRKFSLELHFVFIRWEDQMKEQKILQWQSLRAHCRNPPSPMAGCSVGLWTDDLLGVSTCRWLRINCRHETEAQKTLHVLSQE